MTTHMKVENYKIVSVAPNLIQIEVLDTAAFKSSADSELSIGSYLKISDDNDLSMIAIVQSYRLKQPVGAHDGNAIVSPVFILDALPIGYTAEDGSFKRGGQRIAIPPSRVTMASEEDLQKIYSTVEESKRFVFGSLSNVEAVEVALDGDRLFSTHVAIVGSTGSGKSCTVAKILQEGIKQSSEQQKKKLLNNSHIVIFDLHGEYKAAFPSANNLAIDNLVIPYWLLTSEELEEMFVEISNEQNHNQRSQFRHAVIENKKLKNKGLPKISYDSPVCFSLEEVLNYLTNLNTEVISKVDGAGKDKPKLADGTAIERREESYFEKVLQFAPTSQEKDKKASNGPLVGDLDRFLMRLEAKLNDERLAFILKPRKSDNSEYQTADFADILRQLVGYVSQSKANVTVIDLSGIPFEVLSIVVSLMSRLVFDLCFRHKKIVSSAVASNGKHQHWPVLMVYEEAHKYVPRQQSAAFASVSKSIERIAKEGRKYGISLMIVSQRPSEISETIFSQCNNVVAMRLTNPNDQNYVQRLLPDALGTITESLPALEKREALIIGDAISLPTIVRIGEVEHAPDSKDINVHHEWKQDWLDIVFEKVLQSC